jgi:hypothetical protein
MTGCLHLGIAALLVVCWPLLPAFGAQTTLRGVAIERRIDADPLSTDIPTVVPLIVRLSLGERSSDADSMLARLEEHLASYQSRNIAVVLALGALPPTETELEPWRQFIRGVAERARGRVAAFQIGDVRPGAVPDVNRYVYLLRLAAVQIKSVDVDALVIQGGVPPVASDWENHVLAGGAQAYIDGLAINRGVP